MSNTKNTFPKVITFLLDLSMVILLGSGFCIYL